MTWLRKKMVAILLTGVATIQILQIVLLPTWMDWASNGLILGMVFGAAKLLERT